MSQGLVRNNAANDPDSKPVKARSHFKPNVSVYQTARFGEATPFYGAEIVADDENFSLRVNSDVDTLTLKSPLMAPLRMNKDYFFAPTRSILPHNADRLVTNPLTGDDVVAEDVNCVLKPHVLRQYMYGGNLGDGSNVVNVPNLLKREGARNGEFPRSQTSTTAHFLGYFFTFYSRTVNFLSEGSVLRNLGYNIHGMWLGPRKSIDEDRLSYDEFVEEYFNWILRYVETFQVGLYTGIGGNSGSSSLRLNFVTVVPSLSSARGADNSVVNLRQFLFLLQQGAVVYQVVSNSIMFTDAGSTNTIFPFNPWSDSGDVSLWNNWSININQAPEYTITQELDLGLQKSVNFSRAVAYQLACVQFYTSDATDYVYSPDLWHENQLALARVAVGNANIQSKLFFTYNGLSLPYDSVSSAVIRAMVDQNQNRVVNDNASTSDNFSRYNDTAAFAVDFYMTNLFGFVRSLKFRDYFVGSKKSPMAVGDVNVAVSGGEFSVVDVTKNILRQRFLNQVNRVGRTLKEYSQGIFGVTPMRDPHEVVFLGSTTDVIGAEETQNTGSEQRERFSMTSRLRTESSKFAFEGSFSEFGFVVGILTFDVARPYVNSCDHALYHVDRFDMFNPFMQNIGDQPVFGSEIDFQQNLVNLGYQLRYMEYRQRVDYAAGGFHHFLPGYAFLADYRKTSNVGEVNIKVGPDFIRSRSFEFDDLYTALPNYSPAGYFHFIIRHDICVDANRPMLSAPSIL